MHGEPKSPRERYRGGPIKGDLPAHPVLEGETISLEKDRKLGRNDDLEPNAAVE